MGVAPFFVENVSELQLNAMKLVTTVSIPLSVFYLISKIIKVELVLCLIFIEQV